MQVELQQGEKKKTNKNFTYNKQSRFRFLLSYYCNYFYNKCWYNLHHKTRVIMKRVGREGHTSRDCLSNFILFK